MESIIYASLDEAVEAFRADVMPFLRLSKKLADSGRAPRPTPEAYRNLCRALALLENPERLRERLAKIRRADGTAAAFEFSPEAAALWKKTFPR
jgi:hypothetical protein